MTNDEVLAHPGRLVLLAVVFECSLALAAVAVGWLFDFDPLATLDWTWQAVGWGIVGALPLVPIMVWCCHSRWSACRAITHMVRRVLVPYFSQCTWLDLALVSIAAGIGEEVLFRGLIQAAVTSWTWPWLGLIVASLIFGLAHCITPGYVVFATAFGVYVGALWIWSGNLLLPIVAHSMYDLLALVYLVRIMRTPPGEP